MEAVSARWRFSSSRLLFLLLVAVQIALLMAFKGLRLSFLLVCGLSVFAVLMQDASTEKLLLLALLVAGLRPYEAYPSDPRYEAVIPALIALLWLVNSVASRPTADCCEPRRVLRVRAGALETTLYLWLAAVAAGTLMGIIRGHQLPYIGQEAIRYSYFGLAIVVIHNEMSERGIRLIVFSLVALSLFVSFKYISILIHTHGMQRAVSDQQHLLNIGIPLVVAFYLLSKSAGRRLLWGLLLVPMLIATVITLTRAMWIYVPFSLVLLTFLLVRHRHIRFPLAPALVLTGAALLVVLTKTPGIVAARGRGGVAGSLATRAQTFGSLATDLSLLSRYDLGLQALDRFRHNPIFGTGIGDVVRYRIVYSSTPSMLLDSSYLTVVWKLGLIGIVIFLAIYFIFLWRVWFVYRNAQTDFQRATSVAVFVAFVALLMIGIESGILCIYRFNLVWAVLMGIFEKWAAQIEGQRAARASPSVEGSASQE